MKKTINCPCGWTMTSEDEDELVKSAQDHAKTVHDLKPSREEILALAKPE